jgi:hypothetical protein
MVLAMNTAVWLELVPADIVAVPILVQGVRYTRRWWRRRAPKIDQSQMTEEQRDRARPDMTAQQLRAARGVTTEEHRQRARTRFIEWNSRD